MKIIQPGFKIITPINGNKILKVLEKIGRVCYKSEDKITDISAQNFIKVILTNKHESVLEHINITVKIICDRGISHEQVRHRIGAYTQEATHYCNYSKDKFKKQLTFINPFVYTAFDKKTDTKQYLCYEIWYNLMQQIEKAYMDLIALGALPQEARSVLPNSLKTELYVTYNLREWRHVFKIRTAIGNHYQMRALMYPLLNKFKKIIPLIFNDIN